MGGSAPTTSCALLASAVSICGVNAAIAAAGAVQAKREQLAYAASLVIAFALPSIFLLPWLSDLLGLSDAVAGTWIGANIDTTAATNRHHRQDHPERVDRCRGDRAGLAVVLFGNFTVG